MKIWTRWHFFCVAFLALLAAGSLRGAEPQKQKLPEADIQAFLVAAQMPSLNISNESRLARDFDAAWFKWCQHAIIDPFASRLQEGSAKNGALKVAATGIAMMREMGRDQAATEKLATDCNDMVQQGVDDPLILWLQSWAVYHSTYDLAGCRKLFNRAFTDVRLDNAPAALRLFMLWKMDQILLEAGKEGIKGEVVIEAARKSIQDQSYRAEEDEILVENLHPMLKEKFQKNHDAEMRALCAMPQLSEWARSVLTAVCDYNEAWVARGHKLADKVPPEAWNEFGAKMEAAARGFTHAWELRRDRPMPACYMVSLRSVSGLPAKDTSRDWLDRTVAAQFDYMKSYDYFLNGLRPRWGGDEAQILGLGLACALTERYDTKVPYFFFDALDIAVKDTEDWRAICRQPLIASVAIALRKQQVQDAVSPGWKEVALAELGIYAWACGDYKTGAEALAQVHDKFRRGPQATARKFHTTEVEIRAQCLINGGNGP